MKSEEVVVMSKSIAFDYLGHDWGYSLPELPRDLDFFKTSLRLLKELEVERGLIPAFTDHSWVGEFKVPVIVDDDDNVLATAMLPGPVDIMIGTKFTDEVDGGRNAQRMTRFSEHLFADYLGDISKDALMHIQKGTDLDTGRSRVSGMIFTARDLILIDFFRSLGLPSLNSNELDFTTLGKQELPKYLNGVPEVDHRRDYLALSELEKQHVMDMFFFTLANYLGYPEISKD
jgi:hypothetical protein